MLQAIDYGAEDFDSDEYGYEIITSPGILIRLEIH